MFATADYKQGPRPATMSAHHHMADIKTYSALVADRKTRRDRWMAIGIFAMFAVIMGLLISLALLSGNTLNTGAEGYEYWMMP